MLKVIPIEGTDEINGAQQKRFDEILQEVIITQELSALRYDTANRTVGFVEVLNVRLVEGRYPASLLNLWNAYKEHHGTDNESPAVFDDNQLYIVFELANCGLDLEAFEFKNADQSNSVFKQVRDDGFSTSHYFPQFLRFIVLWLDVVLFIVFWQQFV